MRGWLAAFSPPAGLGLITELLVSVSRLTNGVIDHLAILLTASSVVTRGEHLLNMAWSPYSRRACSEQSSQVISETMCWAQDGG